MLALILAEPQHPWRATPEVTTTVLSWGIFGMGLRLSRQPAEQRAAELDQLLDLVVGGIFIGDCGQTENRTEKG